MRYSSTVTMRPHSLMQKGEIFGRDIVFYFAAIAVYIVVGLTAVYTMFLLALSKIALSVLISMGPIFMVLLFFESTRSSSKRGSRN